jgi:hypothetical protein
MIPDYFEEFHSKHGIEIYITCFSGHFYFPYILHEDIQHRKHHNVDYWHSQVTSGDCNRGKFM